MYANLTAPNPHHRPLFLLQYRLRPCIKTVLIRKGVGVGEIDRAPGDRAGDDIELGRLVEVVLGLNTKGILKKVQFSMDVSNLEQR